jgi:hypothetical protein
MRVEGRLTALSGGSRSGQEIRRSILIGQRCEGVVAVYGALVHEGQACLIMKLYGPGPPGAVTCP